MDSIRMVSSKPFIMPKHLIFTRRKSLTNEGLDTIRVIRVNSPI